MRRGLAALPALADVQRLCAECGLGCDGARAALHAHVLGLAPAELARLGEEDSAEAEAEHELQLWGDEAGDE